MNKREREVERQIQIVSSMRLNKITKYIYRLDKPRDEGNIRVQTDEHEKILILEA
jgi:hypothetical protein